ncbi:MAG TPA: thioesterase, partial [Desulfovibrio sp.]|nr:thioesterase [Desulfovibrio sp.]
MKQETFTHPSVWLAHRISYGETDAMGIVYYAEYFHIFERARDAIIRLSGMSYRL